MNPQIEPELLAEMTLFPPEQNQPGRVTRPPPGPTFTREQLEEAAKNPWVVVNLVSQVAARRKR